MIKALCEETGTSRRDWEEIYGPETGVGVERWFRNKRTGVEAYVCDDQGCITVEIMGV